MESWFTCVAPLAGRRPTSHVGRSRVRVALVQGRVRVNGRTDPSVDSTVTSPPWLLATWRTIARPRPVPPVPRDLARSTR